MSKLIICKHKIWHFKSTKTDVTKDLMMQHKTKIIKFHVWLPKIIHEYIYHKIACLLGGSITFQRKKKSLFTPFCVLYNFFRLIFAFLLNKFHDDGHMLFNEDVRNNEKNIHVDSDGNKIYVELNKRASKHREKERKILACFCV